MTEAKKRAFNILTLEGALTFIILGNIALALGATVNMILTNYTPAENNGSLDVLAVGYGAFVGFLTTIFPLPFVKGRAHVPFRLIVRPLIALLVGGILWAFLHPTTIDLYVLAVGDAVVVLLYELVRLPILISRSRKAKRNGMPHQLWQVTSRWRPEPLIPEYKTQVETRFGLTAADNEYITHFDFAQVQPYLAEHPLHTLFEFNRGNRGDRLGHLIHILDPFDGLAYIRLPNKRLVYIDDRSVERHDIHNPETLSRLTYPAAQYRHGDGSIGIRRYNVEADWVKSYAPSNPISLGGTTDFMEQYEGWPHHILYNGDGELIQEIPLMFQGEFVLRRGHRGYIFCGIPLAYADLYERVQGEKDEETDSTPYAVLVDGYTPTRHIHLRPLTVEIEQVLGAVERRVPADRLPAAIGWIDEDETPRRPSNHFILRSSRIENIHCGYSGVFYLFWDYKNQFKLITQLG